MSEDFLYGSDNMPMESNFIGACFHINGSSYSFCVQSCTEEDDVFKIKDAKDNVIEVPVQSTRELFNGETIDAVLVGHGKINLTLGKASTNSKIQKYMDSGRQIFGGSEMDEVSDFSITDWRRKYMRG